MRSTPRRPAMLSAPRSSRWAWRIGACALLGGLQWLGDIFVSWVDWPVSGSVVGMLVLLGALTAYGRVPDSIEVVTAPLLRHLMLLLIPSVAAISMHAALVMQSGIVFVVVSVVVTALTVIVTAWTLNRLMRRERP